MFMVDSHCHLDFRDFEGELDDVVGRARDAGVGAMVTICTHLSRFDRVRAIAERYDNIWCSAGVHPHEADGEGEAATVEALMALAADPLVVGIGETGLDYYYHKDNPEWQRQRFRAHIQVANQLNKPVIIHTRDAGHDTLEILRQENADLCSGVIHCFTETQEFANQALEMGFMISFSGIITFRNADRLRKIVKSIPDDKLLIETDSPYLAPIPHRGKQNQPAFVQYVAATLAELRNTSVEHIAEISRNNFYQLFKLAN